METVEDLLAEQSQANSSGHVQALLKSLGSAVVYPDAGNLDTNR